MAYDIPRLDLTHRIGDTFEILFSFRQDDGNLRSFAGKTAVFHMQSGATTYHYESGTDDEVEIVDVPDSDLGPGGVDCGILVVIPYAISETWVDDQRFLYETKEWSDVSGTQRFTLVDGIVTAALGVVDGAD
jgi:hypothetical protein